MHALLALVAAVLACALARPPVLTETNVPEDSSPSRSGFFLHASHDFYTKYLMPRTPQPKYFRDEDPGVPKPNKDIFDKEIDMISQMDSQEFEPVGPFDIQFPYWPPQTFPVVYKKIIYKNKSNFNPYSPKLDIKPEPDIDFNAKKGVLSESVIKNESSSKAKDLFALTPVDLGYFEPATTEKNQTADNTLVLRDSENIFEPRQIRQNPNLSRHKALVAENLDRLRTGLTQEGSAGTEKPHHIHVLETTTDPAESIYTVALVAAIGAAFVMAVIGFAVGWYTLSKKAKAAADVDYPAYGVTGPTVDPSGDRKLAQSAHMYHYQHQKQQIIAMERNGMDQRNGSVSDPESEEENEEGDYTVYECPGFATTGEMEVKNPLFQEEPTPVTPGKCEVVKPQPKE